MRIVGNTEPEAGDVVVSVVAEVDDPASSDAPPDPHATTPNPSTAVIVAAIPVRRIDISKLIGATLTARYSSAVAHGRWRSGRQRTVAAALALIVVATLAACHDSRTPTPPHRSDGRVQTTATALTLDGHVWFPTGFNAYQLGTDWSVNVGCGAQVDLDDYFSRLPPRSLTRFNVFAQFAVNKQSGLVDFGPLDRVFATAKRHNQMVLPVLAGGSGDCENGKFKERGWYVDGWRTIRDLGGMTYAGWMSSAVTRWRDESTIAGWELVGEPEPSRCGDAACTWQTRTCPADAAAVLTDFFDAAGDRLRALDPHRPIFAGLTGGDQCGINGADYATVGASRGIDVLDFHDYGIDASHRTAPAGSNLLARIAQARALRKPIVVNEIGINAGSCKDVTTRAQQFRTAITGHRSAGAAGALLWAFVPDPRESECTYDIGPDDPAWAVIADESR